MLLLRQHVTSAAWCMDLTKLWWRGSLHQGRGLLLPSLDLSGIYLTRERHQAIGREDRMLRLLIMGLLMYDVFTAGSLSNWSIAGLLLLLIRMLKVLSILIITTTPSLGNLVWELNVIECRWSTIFAIETCLVLVITAYRNVLRRWMHHDGLLSRWWWWKETVLLRWPIHLGNLIVCSIYGITSIAVLDNCCTRFSWLYWLLHGLQPQTLIILGLAIAALMWQKIRTLSELIAAPGSIKLSSISCSCWWGELVHL